MVRRVIGAVHGQVSYRQQVTPQAAFRKVDKPIIRAPAVLISANKEQLSGGLPAPGFRSLFPLRDDHLGDVVGRPVHQGMNPAGLPWSRWAYITWRTGRPGMLAETTAASAGAFTLTAAPTHNAPAPNGLREFARIKWKRA